MMFKFLVRLPAGLDLTQCAWWATLYDCQQAKYLKCYSQITEEDRARYKKEQKEMLEAYRARKKKARIKKGSLENLNHLNQWRDHDDDAK